MHVLAATDPANPYGAALPWPAQGPTRSAGAMVVLVDGLLAAHVTRGGKTMTTFFDTFPDGVGDPMPLVVDALTTAVRAGRMQPLSVEKLDGGPAYSLKEIRHWLQVFAQRYYSFSQFKRSALPNGPKVSHGGSLSPRGDWRAPSDMSARIWLPEIEREIPED